MQLSEKRVIEGLGFDLTLLLSKVMVSMFSVAADS